MSWIEGENVHAILGDTILLYLYDQIMNFLFALSYLNDLTEILHDFLPLPPRPDHEHLRPDVPRAPRGDDRPKPSKAPWLREVSGAEPPCLLPWWERASGSSGGACGSGQMLSGETPTQSGGGVSEADRGAGEGHGDDDDEDEEMADVNSEEDHTGETTETTTGTTSTRTTTRTTATSTTVIGTTSTSTSWPSPNQPLQPLPLVLDSEPGSPDAARLRMAATTSVDSPGHTTSLTSTSSEGILTSGCQPAEEEDFEGDHNEETTRTTTRTSSTRTTTGTNSTSTPWLGPTAT